jgi:predicted site-specific integrase-resolvase
MSKLIKISKLAKDLGVTLVTIYNWKSKGKIDFVKSSTGRNFVTYEDYCQLIGIKEKRDEKVVIYTRISNSVNKINLDSQAERLKNYCIAKGYKIHKIIKEIGSGINDNRPQLKNLLENQNFTKIVVEHKDKLTRFGFNYLEVLLRFNNIEIEVVNDAEDDKNDLIQDFVSIITSYCARIYGLRRSKRKTEKLLEELNKDNDKVI